MQLISVYLAAEVLLHAFLLITFGPISSYSFFVIMDPRMSPFFARVFA